MYYSRLRCKSSQLSLYMYSIKAHLYIMYFTSDNHIQYFTAMLYDFPNLYHPRGNVVHVNLALKEFRDVSDIYQMYNKPASVTISVRFWLHFIFRVYARKGKKQLVLGSSCNECQKRSLKGMGIVRQKSQGGMHQGV